LQRGQAIGKEDFINDVVGMNIDFTLYEKCKYNFIAMMALNPANDQEQKEAILSILNYNHNIEVRLPSFNNIPMLTLDLHNRSS